MGCDSVGLNGLVGDVVRSWGVTSISRFAPQNDACLTSLAGSDIGLSSKYLERSLVTERDSSHLRVVIANEKRDRLELLAQVVSSAE